MAALLEKRRKEGKKEREGSIQNDMKRKLNALHQHLHTHEEGEGEKEKRSIPARLNDGTGVTT